MSMTEGTLREERSVTDVKTLLERYPSRPWTSANLSQVLQELLASNVVGDDSDSSEEILTHDDSEIDILQGHSGFSFSRESKFSGLSAGLLLKKSSSMKGKERLGDQLHPSRKSKRSSVDFSLSTSSKTLKKGKISVQKIVDSLQRKGSDLVDLGKLSSKMIRKLKAQPIKEDLPAKIIPRVNEMVDAIRTAMKYDLQPENFKGDDDLEEEIELSSLLKWYRNELESFGAYEISKNQNNRPFIKGIPTFQYELLRPKKHSDGQSLVCSCQTYEPNRLWVETKRKRANELLAFLGEPKKREHSRNVWHCQCKGPRPGFDNKNQKVMKIRVPQSMRPDELKKLNSVPRAEIHKHITPAKNDKVNIKDAVAYKPQSIRPIIQQEMMCHTNEMKCVLLPPPFTGKVTKYETPDWVIEYNKRYVYDYFFQQTKSIPNIAFMDFSYKKNLAVLTEEIIQGCMNRTDIFDEDTCQCTFLCTCEHKTTKKPNATLFDAVRRAKKYCAADLHDNNIYEAGDYMKSGDKTYFVCSKLCNIKMKLHKQLHV